MKRIVKIILAAVFTAAMFTIANSAVSAAQQTVVFTRPSFDIVINGYVVDTEDNMYREYPFYVYNGITYFPMTYNDCATLGIRNDWTSYGGNSITYGYPCTDYNPTYSYRAKPMTATAYMAGDFATPGGRLINAYEQYPIYTCNNVLYFPMTWAWTSRFGWTNTFVDNTLYITADINYFPVSLVNRSFNRTASGNLVYQGDVVNNTSKAVSSWKFEVRYYDRYDNLIRDNYGYTGSVVSGGYLTPNAYIQNQYYVDFTEKLLGTSCIALSYMGATYVEFADGTKWVRPLLG